MNKNISIRSNLKLIFALSAVFLLIGMAGCGPNASEREKNNVEKREEVKRQLLKNTLEISDGLREKYKAIDFPWGTGVASEENNFFLSALAQRFVLENNQKPILLMMNLEDVEQSRNGLVAKFTLKFEDRYFEIPKELKLSLAISEDQFTELKAMRIETSLPSVLQNKRSIAVVAKINQISSMKDAIYDEDGKTSLKSELHGTGVLLDAKKLTE